MDKILIVILIVSLFFIDGCSTLVYTTGKENNIKEELELEKIDSIPKDNWLTVSLRNNEIIKGKFISCVNDTLSVTFNINKNLNVPISNSQFLSISHDMASYKIPLDQVKDIHARKADYSVVGVISGLVVFFIVITIIKLSHSGVGNFERVNDL